MNSASANQPAFRFNRTELSGALGDMGTFIPLLVGMVNRCGLQFGPALLFAGVMNVITGLVFRIPMPVQPMKAIAAVAISEGLTEAQILTAGIVTGAVVLLLGLTGLIGRLNRTIPRSVVRGLQLAIGLQLLTKGIGMVTGTGVWLGADSITLGIVCALCVLVLYFSTRIPGALVVFGIGLIALLVHKPNLLTELHVGMVWHLPDLTHWSDWRSGILQGAIPQIPLTLLNSVIAVCALSGDLLPHRPAQPRPVSVSVGLMNLAALPFGGMPMCHGAGGLAAQYRFGARTGGSVIMLGGVKIALALTLGASLFAWLHSFPQSVLGVLLTFSGIELALVCRDQHARVDFFIMLLTAGGCLAVNTAVGFVLGWTMAVLLIQGIFRIEPPRL